MKFAADLREAFLSSFAKQGHERVPSSSLVPRNDPTLFFTNAGMVQFKDLFTGAETRTYNKACSSQKCMRVSGKHNDLENVGFTARHHTFFEMLGNFSFGDYFKKEAIAFAWEFLTKTLSLPKDRFCITIFRDDDEAEKLWKKHVSADRIFRFDEKDNFWAMGETGPCGPCSELHWDSGKGPISRNDFESGRLTEIWNLVFMQFNRSADGTLEKLAKPSIDTGMGLERLAAIIQGVGSNWETDLFVPIIRKVEEVIGHREGESPAVQSALRVIADHVRCATFLISDGVIPANEDRGYVLRRIIRRAIRYGRKLEQKEPFLFEIFPRVATAMQDVYPELKTNSAFIEKVLRAEEEQFFQTLERGLEYFTASRKKMRDNVIPGDVVFQLHDTYGFPLDLTQMLANEGGLAVDLKIYEELMQAQRERARKHWRGSGEEKITPIWQEIAKRGEKTEFVGYERDEGQAPMTSLVMQGSEVEAAREGDEIQFITATTPFYGEGGGQVGDIGRVQGKGFEIEVIDTKKPVAGLHVHYGKVTKGEVKRGDVVRLHIASERRAAIRRNHTATHLLHRALRQTLGEHVKQAGSYLDEHGFRFDFSHFQAVTKDELQKIEQIVREEIQKDATVTGTEMPYDEAIAKGAIAFFGEKYGARVRLVEVEGFSKELCGGTHVRHTGEIGAFKIISESSVASGVRRIEAVTGDRVQAWELQEGERQQAEEMLRLEKERARAKLHEESREAIARYRDLAGSARSVSGISVVLEQIDGADVATLRTIAEMALAKMGSGVVVIGAKIEEKAAVVCMVSQDLASTVKAGEVIQHISPRLGGKGGGRPNFAQGGGPSPEKLSEALQAAFEFIQQKLA